MEEREYSGKTVEEALLKAQEELGASLDELTYEVTAEASKGFLGFGSKEAVILVRKVFDPVRTGTAFLAPIFEALSVKPEITVNQKDQFITFDLTGKHLGILIGRRGDTLDALQFLLNLAVNKESTEHVRLIIDVENYRTRRAETLQVLALKMAEKAKKTGRRVMLEPMNAHERRIIHLALESDQGITTYSEGLDPYRKIVINPKDKTSKA